MIEVRHVSKYYGAHAAVTELSFDIPQGQVVGLLGLNGAGKTTTLRILSGLLVPTSGAVYVGGVNMADDPEGVRGRIGFLPQPPPLYPEMTVRGYLRFVGQINGVRVGLAAALDAALGATDLLAVQHEQILTLSDGYQRRIGIAQTLVHSPHLILLDEPLQGLDPVQVAHMRQLIARLRGRHTVVLSSHLLAEVHALCDRVLVLDEGRIVAQGEAQTLAAQVARSAQAMQAGQTTPTCESDAPQAAASLQCTLEVEGTAQVAREVAQRFGKIASCQTLSSTTADPALRTASTGARTPATVHLQLLLADDCRPALAAACHDAQLGLRTLALAPPSLEATFLALLGRAPAEPHGAHGPQGEVP